MSSNHHDADELYSYRMAYHLHAIQLWVNSGFPVVKSLRHSDGELCFGGDVFIVSAELPTGQVTNHYKLKHWDMFSVPEVELAPEYDGHTPQVALKRLLDAADSFSTTQNMGE